MARTIELTQLQSGAQKGLWKATLGQFVAISPTSLGALTAVRALAS